jgi:lipopolysaccharide export system permease protein
MKILTRYLLRAHIGPFIFALVTLTGVILINTLAKELASFAGKGLPIRTILEFFVLSLPANLALTLPMSVLVAVLYTFSTLAAENEIMALRANGIDLRRFTLPLVAAALLVTGGMIWFNDRVLPPSNYRWRMLMMDVAQARPLTAWQERFLNPISDNAGTTPFYLEAARLDRDGGKMFDVAIYDVGSDQITRTIEADSGLIQQNSDRTDMLLTLFNGEIREVNFSEPANLGVSRFEKQVMRMKDISRALERTTGSQIRTDRDMTIGMMQARIDSLRVEKDAYEKAAEDTTLLPAAVRISSGEAPPTPEESGEATGAAGNPGLQNIGGRDPEAYALSRVVAIENDIRDFQVEIQKKFSIAVAALVFVLIGVPIALRFPHGGIGMVIAVSLSIFGIYYVGLIGGETLAGKGYMTPLLSMWLTNILFGALGIVGYILLGREHGTSRGGAFSEMFFRLSQRFSRTRSETRP